MSSEDSLSAWLGNALKAAKSDLSNPVVLANLTEEDLRPAQDWFIANTSRASVIRELQEKYSRDDFGTQRLLEALLEEASPYENSERGLPYGARGSTGLRTHSVRVKPPFITESRWNPWSPSDLSTSTTHLTDREQAQFDALKQIVEKEYQRQVIEVQEKRANAKTWLAKRADLHSHFKHLYEEIDFKGSNPEFLVKAKGVMSQYVCIFSNLVKPDGDLRYRILERDSSLDIGDQIRAAEREVVLAIRGPVLRATVWIDPDILQLTNLRWPDSIVLKSTDGGQSLPRLRGYVIDPTQAAWFEAVNGLRKEGLISTVEYRKGAGTVYLAEHRLLRISRAPPADPSAFLAHLRRLIGVGRSFALKGHGPAEISPCVIQADIVDPAGGNLRAPPHAIGRARHRQLRVLHNPERSGGRPRTAGLLARLDGVLFPER